MVTYLNLPFILLLVLKHLYHMQICDNNKGEWNKELGLDMKLYLGDLLLFSRSYIDKQTWNETFYVKITIVLLFMWLEYVSENCKQDLEGNKTTFTEGGASKWLSIFDWCVKPQEDIFVWYADC